MVDFSLFITHMGQIFKREFKIFDFCYRLSYNLAIYVGFLRKVEIIII